METSGSQREYLRQRDADPGSIIDSRVAAANANESGPPTVHSMLDGLSKDVRQLNTLVTRVTARFESVCVMPALPGESGPGPIAKPPSHVMDKVSMIAEDVRMIQQRLEILHKSCAL